MRVMVAMSGGVDSSVAAALLAADGHDVVGVTMRLWGGESDTGCCSVSDVDDARRAADALGIEHLVFNFSDDFDAHVVSPYVAAHRRGDAESVHRVQPQGQVRPAVRAGALLGFDAVATGHHARIGGTAAASRSSAAPTGPRTRATSCTCSTRASSPARCSRSDR